MLQFKEWAQNLLFYILYDQMKYWVVIFIYDKKQ